MLIVDGTLVPTRDHAVAERSKNYRYSTNHQVVIDADTRRVVVVGRPLPGNRNDCKAWELSGAKDAVCSCSLSCLCAFVQAPAHGSCLFTLVWQVHEGHCGDVRLHGLEVVALGEFAGNMWAESTDSRMSVMFSIDAKGTAARREALEEIFRGNVGGWPGTFGSLIGDVREVRYAPIAFDAVEDLGTGVQQWPAR